MIPTASIFNDQPDLDTMGGRLSRAREAAGLSIRDMAWRLGVSAATMKGWESDRSQPEARRLPTIAGLLNVSLSWILHGVGTSPDEPGPVALSGTFTAQLDRLKLLHMETGHLITKLEGDLGRLREAPPI
ncbi:helix-turn-helix transcriptional regulator [Pseudaminobacter sp. 19-2017]|uniref:Helix-turn-helix transcriptional regulator n=1 Tax=Pseudaminobacter soli (ex Zhang et al. 2022) TaxID=2831468 RepID=A0A942IC27_9HYPH|nr:helix-turn-helix transcriptional regulator [Pseudaminobacter soli]